MFPALIQLYRDRGFTFVSLPQAQQDPAYSHDPNQPLLHGGTLQEQEFTARKLSYPSLNSPQNSWMISALRSKNAQLR